MVVREGIAPSTSLCKRDMILFHHRTEIGCRGWNRTSIRAFKGRCPTIRRPGNELVEPEVVATSPYRIKSPVPVCCGFDSLKLACQAVARDVHDTGGFHLRYGVVVFGGSWVTSEGWWAREDL